MTRAKAWKEIVKAIYWVVVYVGSFTMGCVIGLGAQKLWDSKIERRLG